MILCPQCEKENPSSANHCMNCGSVLVQNEKLDEVNKLHKELDEIKRTNELLKTALETTLKTDTPPVQTEKTTRISDNSEKKESVGKQFTNPPPPIPTPKERVITTQKPENNKKKLTLIFILVSLAIVVFGIFYYFNIYIPAKIDREAPRYYTIADKTNLRSSKEAGVDYNRIASLNYGSELITYSHNVDGWSDVKDASGNKGFISSEFLLDKTDFGILNGIFGDQESKLCISTAKCRLALLSYYKTNNLSSSWKVFCRLKDLKPNSVLYPRLFNKNSKFTDFAVIIKNMDTGDRKVLIFGFNDDGSLAWAKEGFAPAVGYIQKMSVNYSGEILIEFSN
jgi:hypothetical protein